MPVNTFYLSTENQLHAIMLELRTISIEIKKLKEGQNKIFEFNKTLYNSPGLRRQLRHRSQVQSCSIAELQSKRSHRERFAEFFAGMKGHETPPVRHQHKAGPKNKPLIELPTWTTTATEPKKVRTPNYINLEDEDHGNKRSDPKPTFHIPLSKGGDHLDATSATNSPHSETEAGVPIFRYAKHRRSVSETVATASPKFVNLSSDAEQHAFSKLPDVHMTSTEEVINQKLHADHRNLFDQPKDILDYSLEDSEEEELSFEQQLRLAKSERWHMKFCPYYDDIDLSGWRRFRQYLYFIFHDENHSKIALCVLFFIMGLIIVSTLFYIIETVPSLASYTEVWSTSELVVTVLFTIEYVLRLFSVKNRCTYILKPINIVDLLAVLPWYVERLWPTLPTGYLRVVRIVRLARLARLRNLFSEYIEIMISSIYGAAEEAGPMMGLMILVEVVLFGCSVYAFEKDNNLNGGFESIPDSMWWVVVTMTTVGYGDMSPTTVVGRMLGVFCMLSGIVLMSICIIIIGGNFEQAHHAFLIEKEKHMKRKENMRQNKSIWRKDTMKILTQTESAPARVCVLNSFQFDKVPPRSQSLKLVV